MSHQSDLRNWRAYATEPLIPLSNSEVSTTPLEELPRLVIGTVIPLEAGDSASGTAAVRKSEARTRIREKYISRRIVKYFWGLYVCGGHASRVKKEMS